MSELAAARTNNGWLQVNENGTRHMLASAGLAEKSVEGVVSAADGLVRRHSAVRLDAVFQTVQLPACVANLHTGLSNVDRDALTLQRE